MEDKLRIALETGVDDADKDKDGYLSREEFKEFVPLISEEVSEDFHQYLFRGLDLECQGKLPLAKVKNYVSLLKDNWKDIKDGKPPVELLKVFYRSMDANRDRRVNLEEMRNFLCSIDRTMTTHLAAVELRKMDKKSNDGVVEFYEYCRSFGLEVGKRADAYDGAAGSSCCILL